MNSRLTPYTCRGCGRRYQATKIPVTRGGKPFHSKECRDRYIERTGDGPEELKDLLRF